MLVPATAVLPEPQARLAAVRSVVRAASRQAAAVLPLREVRPETLRPEVRRATRAEVERQTAAARLGSKIREQVATRVPVPREVVGARGAKEPEVRELEVREPGTFWAPAGTLAARGREAGAPRERAAWPVRQVRVERLELVALRGSRTAHPHARLVRPGAAPCRRSCRARLKATDVLRGLRR